LFLVVDERGMFREDNFQKAVAALADAAADGGRGGKGRPKAGGGKDGKKGGNQQVGGCVCGGGSRGEEVGRQDRL
jgi:ATP-dependent RNA helicase DOB1